MKSIYVDTLLSFISGFIIFAITLGLARAVRANQQLTRKWLLDQPAAILRITSLCALVLMFAVWASNMTAMPFSSNQSTRLLTLRGRIIAGEIIDDGSDSVKVTLKLSLEIRNDGSKPALILRQDPVTIDSRFVATPTAAINDIYLFRSQSLPSNGRSPEWEETQEKVDKPQPPTDLIRKLAPNETWTFEVTNWFYIGKKDNIDPKSQPWSVVREASPVWHQITLQLWSRDIESNADRKKLRFSKMLQSRWRKYGELQLESLTSEPIAIDFSAFTFNK